MKRFGLSLTFASATLFLGPAAPAQAPADRSMSPPNGAMTGFAPMSESGRGAELLQRYDKNGDGKIDDDERADAKEEMLKEQVDRQMARVTASQATAEQLRQRALEFFDENRDGSLNDEERAALQKFVETRAAVGTPASRAAWREELIRRVDKNANGRLEADELAVVRGYLDEIRAEPPSKPSEKTEIENLEDVIRAAIAASPELRAVFDRNADQRLDDKEWAAARPRIRQALTSNDDEQRRVNAVAAEVARRRELREKAASQPEPKK